MLEPIFAEFDRDKSGSLDRQELSLLVKKSLEAQREYLPEMMLKMALAEADRVGAAPEARKAMEKMLSESLGDLQHALDGMVAASDTLVPSIVAGLDADHDGFISKQEFLAGYLTQANAALDGVTGGAR